MHLGVVLLPFVEIVSKKKIMWADGCLNSFIEYNFYLMLFLTG
jgi:hypothetical protein